MKSIFLVLLLLSSIICEELAVTKEYTEYLKKTVSWEVTEYEDNVFKGWTMSEFRALLGLKPDTMSYSVPIQPELPNLPSALSWKTTCDHGPKNQANCGSCWSFGTVGMLASRCCLHSKDHGWLSTQELVSCDGLDNGCNGGSPKQALIYIEEQEGLVHDACFPYTAKKTPCVNKCADGKDWEDSHVCDCKGVTECRGVKSMKSCLQTGPIVVGYGVCKSFMDYKSGIYKCDCQQYEGYHAVLLQGYSDTPECHWVIRNSWGPNWGEGGYFKIACETCGIEGNLKGANMMCNKVE